MQSRNSESTEGSYTACRMSYSLQCSDIPKLFFCTACECCSLYGLCITGVRSQPRAYCNKILSRCRTFWTRHFNSLQFHIFNVLPKGTKWCIATFCFPRRNPSRTWWSAAHHSAVWAEKLLAPSCRAYFVSILTVCFMNFKAQFLYGARLTWKLLGCYQGLHPFLSILFVILV